MTSLPLFSFHDRELYGNTLGTLRERFGNSMGMLWWTLGMLQELCGNSMGTLWELCGNKGLCIPYFTFIEFWILSLCYIIHCTNTIYYVVHSILYNTHALYVVLYHIQVLYNIHVLYIAMRSELYEPTLYFYTLHPPLPWQWLWDNHFLGGNNVENIEAMFFT
jgi:hypothetical protein